MSKWIPILVRAEYLQDVMQFVIEKEAGFSGGIALPEEIDMSDFPTSRPDAGPAADESQEERPTWSIEDLTRLAKGTTETTRRWTLAMDACANQPETFYTTSEIASMTGMSISEWRDAPRKISRHLRTHYPSVPLNDAGDHIWPLMAQTRPETPSEVSWAMTAETARLWRKVRS